MPMRLSFTLYYLMEAPYISIINPDLSYSFIQVRTKHSWIFESTRVLFNLYLLMVFSFLFHLIHPCFYFFCPSHILFYLKSIVFFLFLVHASLTINWTFECLQQTLEHRIHFMIEASWCNTWMGTKYIAHHHWCSTFLLGSRHIPFSCSYSEAHPILMIIHCLYDLSLAIISVNLLLKHYACYALNRAHCMPPFV